MSAPLIRQTKVARVINCIDAKDPNGDLEKLLFDDDLSVLERNECMYALLPYIGITGRLNLLKRFTVAQDIKSRDQYGSAFCTMLSHVCRFGHMNMLTYIHETVCLLSSDLQENAEYITMNDQLKVLKYFIYICKIDKFMLYTYGIPKYAMKYGRTNILQFLLEVGHVNMSLDDKQYWTIDADIISKIHKASEENIEAMRWLADNYQVYRSRVIVAFNTAVQHYNYAVVDRRHYHLKNIKTSHIIDYILGERSSLVEVDALTKVNKKMITPTREWGFDILEFIQMAYPIILVIMIGYHVQSAIIYVLYGK